MKKLAYRIILLIAAVTVFFTGAGVTFVNYCCSGCTVEQTLVMTKVHSCCSQKTVAEKKPSCCSSHTQVTDQTDSGECSLSGKGHCKASRLSADIDMSVFRPHVSSPFVWISDALPVLPVNMLSGQVETTDIYTRFESPPDIPPREYLTLIRVLII